MMSQNHRCSIMNQLSTVDGVPYVRFLKRKYEFKIHCTRKDEYSARLWESLSQVMDDVLIFLKIFISPVDTVVIQKFGLINPNLDIDYRISRRTVIRPSKYLHVF